MRPQARPSFPTMLEEDGRKLFLQGLLAHWLFSSSLTEDVIQEISLGGYHFPVQKASKQPARASGKSTPPCVPFPERELHRTFYELSSQYPAEEPISFWICGLLSSTKLRGKLCIQPQNFQREGEALVPWVRRPSAQKAEDEGTFTRLRQETFILNR